MSRGARRGRVTLIGIVAAVLLAALAATLLANGGGSATEAIAPNGASADEAERTDTGSTDTEAPAPTAAAPALGTDGSGSVPAPGSSLAGTAPRGLRPVRIRIPAIHVDASMTDLGIAADGSIEVPSVPAQAGWLDTTPAPGEQGPAVVAGHVDSETGPAVFYLLSSLEPGDEVVVTRRNGSTARFTVDGIRTYPQDAFPTSEVYGPVPGPALRLVTCGGDYVKDDGGYQANVVVYAS